jgi:hypothetical protein
MSTNEQDIKKKTDETIKHEPRHLKDYVSPKDPSGPIGSTKTVDGKQANELGYKIGSPNGDELSAIVQQDNKNGTTTAKVKVSDGQTSAEVYVREQKGSEAYGASVTHRTDGSESYIVSGERNNQTRTTSAKLEHQDGKDKKSATVTVTPSGTTISGAITEDMGNNGTVRGEVSTNLKNRFKAGGGYEKDSIGGSFTTEKSQDGWTNTFGLNVKKGRVEVETSVKDAPNKSPEVSVKGTINVGPTPGKPEPSFLDGRTLISDPAKHTKFSQALETLEKNSPADRKLYEDSLEVVKKGLESGKIDPKFKGYEKELAINIALLAKEQKMTAVADIQIDARSNPKNPSVSISATYPIEEAKNRHGDPSQKAVPLSTLTKTPENALRDIAAPKPGPDKTPEPSNDKSPTARLMGFAAVSPGDVKLYKDSLAVVEKAVKSGALNAADMPDGKEQFALNVALRAKQLGMESVADVQVDKGKVHISERLPVGDCRLNKEDPSYQSIGVDQLNKPPEVALLEMQKIQAKSTATEQKQPSNELQQKNEAPTVETPSEKVQARR